MADRSILSGDRKSAGQSRIRVSAPSGFARNVRLPIVSLVTCMGVSSNGED
jgi:hypothetical protein